MKVENIKILKKIFTSPIFWLCTILVVIFPAIIHLLFKIPGNNITVAVWTVESILEYGSTIIGSLIVYFTVVLTLNKNQEENEKLIHTTIEENKKIISNSHNEKKYECFSQSASKVLSQINNITGTLVEYSNSAFLSTSLKARKNIIEKMNSHFFSLETTINEMKLFIPEMARKYFNVRFFTTTYLNFKTNFGYAYIAKNIFSAQQANIIDMYILNLTNYFPGFITEINKILSLISDYYYEDSIFIMNQVNGIVTSEADNYLKNYN